MFSQIIIIFMRSLNVRCERGTRTDQYLFFHASHNTLVDGIIISWILKAIVNGMCDTK